MQVIWELFFRLSEIVSYSLSLVNVSSDCNQLLFLVTFYERIRVDLQKIEVVKQWPRRTSAIDIKSFLGIAGYYRRFVKIFSSIASYYRRFVKIFSSIASLWLGWLRTWSSFNGQMIVWKALYNWKLDWLQLLSWLYQRVQIVMWSIAMHPELSLVVCWCNEIRL